MDSTSHEGTKSATGEATKNEATKNEATNKKVEKTYAGSCHCGAVQFRVTADLAAGAGRCNCSVCTKVAQTGGIVKPEAFQLVSSEEALSSYEWGGRTAKRFFCKTCGIHCFSRGSLPELGGAYVSVNYNCLDGVELGELKVVYWDGRHNNWHAGPRETPWKILASATA